MSFVVALLFCFFSLSPRTLQIQLCCCGYYPRTPLSQCWHLSPLSEQVEGSTVGGALGVGCLPSRQEALGSTPSTAETKCGAHLQLQHLGSGGRRSPSVSFLTT